MGFIPNLYDPAQPLPVSMTPEKLLKVYEILYSEPEQEEDVYTEEERALYGEALAMQPPEW